MGRLTSLENSGGCGGIDGDGTDSARAWVSPGTAVHGMEQADTGAFFTGVPVSFSAQPDIAATVPA